jgi:hypothetical protein
VRVGVVDSPALCELYLDVRAVVAQGKGDLPIF